MWQPYPDKGGKGGKTYPPDGPWPPAGPPPPKLRAAAEEGNDKANVSVLFVSQPKTLKPKTLKP